MSGYDPRKEIDFAQPTNLEKVHGPVYGEVRPTNPGALSLEGITPHTWITHHGKTTGEKRYYILEGPTPDDETYLVTLLMRPDDYTDEQIQNGDYPSHYALKYRLDDMGVVPNSHQMWSQWNHTTLTTRQSNPAEG